MVGLTPEEFFRMYEHTMEPAVAEQFSKLLDQNIELQDNEDRILREWREEVESLTCGPLA